MSTSLKDFDRSKLECIERYGGRKLLKRLIDSFLRHTPARLAALRAGHAEGDLRRVAENAHMLVSSAGNLGAMRLSGCSRQLQEAAEQGQAAAIADLLGQLEAGFLGVRDLLESEGARL